MSFDLVHDVRDGIDVHLAPLTVDQFQKMVRDGILHDGESIELIQGALSYKERRDEAGGIMTHGPQHLWALNKLMALLAHWVATRQMFLQVQGPVVVSETSEPDPDCYLIRGASDDYVDEVPRAADVAAVFEVSFSSLPSDRRTKQRLYANAGIPIDVIINLQKNLIDVLSSPSAADGRYLSNSEYHSSKIAVLELGEFGQLSLPVSNLL